MKDAITSPETRSMTINRSTFLKGTVATAATVAASGVVTDAALAKGKMAAPWVKRSPSGEALIWAALPFSTEQVAAFNKVYPDVKITQKVMTGGAPSLQTHLITGIGVPDGIHFIDDGALGQYAPVLYDVSRYLEPYLHKIAPYKLAVSRQAGRFVAIPWDVDPAFLIYRTDLVARAGVDVGAIHTYDDLIVAARQVQAKIPSCQKPLAFIDGPSFFTWGTEAMAWQQHTGIVDAKGNIQLKSQAYTNIFNYYEKAYKAGVTNLLLWQTPSLYDAWNNGKTCFLHYADWFTHWNQPGLQASWGKYGLAKLPVFNKSDSPWANAGGSGYVVPLKAKRPDLGALFGIFQLFDRRALSQAASGRVYEAVLPAASDLWPYVNYKRPIINPSINEHALLVEAARNIPTTYRYPSYFDRTFPYYGAKIHQVLTGKMSAREAQDSTYNDVMNNVVKRAY